MRFLYLLIFIFLAPLAWAQPLNDNCTNAGLIYIPNGGWDYGTFSSDTVNLAGSTLQAGEFIPTQQVARSKTVWFKFSLPTTREVIITLKQPGIAPFPLPATAAGWTLYRTNTCLPTLTDMVDPPIINIEGYTHRCLRKGNYLIQVSATLAANDSVFIDLQTGPASATEILYDNASQPLNFGLISGLNPTGLANQFYETGCQSLFQGETPCPSTFTQSTWHTFTTDNFIDFYRFELSESPWVLPNVPARTFGYRLYKGNCMLDSIADGIPAGGTNLTEVVSCKTLTQTSASTYAADFSMCLLEPNTTYSIQLFFPDGYSRQINVKMYETGGGKEISGNPNAIASTHQLGTLPFGTSSTTDFLTCEGLLSHWTACTSMVPPTGYYLYSGDTFDLASYRTFTLNTTTNVYIDDIITNQPGLLFRLYSGDVTSAGCSGLTLYKQFYGGNWLYCLPAGQYTLQILGRTEIHQIFNYWRSNLGKQHTVTIQVAQSYASLFGLHTNTEIDAINAGNPLVNGSQYYAAWDTFDCQLTYLPEGNVCSSTNENNNRAIYRKIVIDQDGILVVGGGVWNRFSYRLYRGDASTAPVLNNRLQGLVDQAGCQNTYYPFKVCVTPGVYTLAVLGDSADVGYGDREWFKFYTFPPTAYTTPATAEVLSAITLTQPSVTATPTRFSCLDNPNTILGNTPCNGATKLIYREVYFDQPSLMQFAPTLTSLNTSSPTVYYRFFTGRISDGTISSLYKNCATSFTDCIPKGWYTIVAYGFGNTYVGPNYTSGLGGNIGDLSGFTITIDPRVQKFRTIATSENANGGNPMNWYLHSSGGSTPKYPRNDTTYTLATEFWDCANDLPLDAGISTCIPSNNRVSYRVFTLGKPSYLYINNLNPYPYGYQSRLYAGDLRTATPPFTIVQPCITDEIRMCASAGTYTLVTFAGDAHVGYTHTPKIYIDSLGTSKFDYAAQAYNFGDIPNDNTEYLGNPSDTPDALGRAPSSDFFFCSTGASATDPNNNCPIGTNPPGNTLPNPTNPRRNLWYSFTVTGPGRVYVSVYNKTPKSLSQSPFSVYYSANTAIPPVDSISPPLQFIATSTNTYYCTNAQTISYYLEPCAGIIQRRYYIEVQNNSGNEPNVQVEVGVRFEPAPPAYVLFDHYSQANHINANPTVENVAPYTPLSISSGTYTGYMGNLNCATKDAPDQTSCGTKTLWYAFDIASTGQIRINYDRPAPNGTTFNTQDLILLREVIPGDSSSSGLQLIPLTSVNYNNNPSYNPGTTYTWGQACVFPGRYYIMFTGCRFPTETVIPRIWVVPQVGDLCSEPLTVTVPPAGGYFTSTANITCHTIGEGPGEDGTNMGCLGSPVGMKTHWFKVDLNGSTKYNLDVELAENTTATSSDIKYRIGYGDCNYMTFDNCVSEGLHIILNLKCRLPGSFYIQVLMPEWTAGDISLKLTATQVTDTNCTPIDPEKPRASFTYNASCVDTAVYFYNYSSIGTGITYEWNFGDGSFSNAFEPIHQYADTGTYLVTLIVDNTFLKDTIQQYVSVYPVPQTSFSVPDTLVAGAPVSFINTSTNALPDAVYYWNFCSSGTTAPCSADIPFYFGETPPPITYTHGGWKYICLTVTNGNCDSIFCKNVYVKYDNIFLGGPFDGADYESIYANCFDNIFVGGPYDGAANQAIYSNCFDNIFVGGPYDGAANQAVYANCFDNIFVGGPYDGAANQAIYSNCTTNIFVGGPFDGAATGKAISLCTPSSWFTGGPYDGSASITVLGTCPVSYENIFTGGPYDGAANQAVYSNCFDNIFAGGPYDGAANQAVYSNCFDNIFVGGPFDGFASQAIYSNCFDNIFVGGPFDGFASQAIYSNCFDNIFVGGPYDGFARSVARAFCETPIYVGGPFDGHGLAYFNSYIAKGDSICAGNTATLVTNTPTDWYNSPTGGTPLAIGTTTYTTPPLNQTTIYYVQNPCFGGRSQAVVQVNQLLTPAFNHNIACVGEPTQFFNQTIVTTNPQPSIGGTAADISFLGTTGAPAPTGGITFSSQQVLNFNYLKDGLNNNVAWQSANASSPGTEWVQWNYVNPKAVTRFYYWNDPTQPNRSPKQLRLYYSTGGPWVLIKVINPPYPSNGTFDTGVIPETNGVFARRWKLEVDVDANGPMWREFQVFAGTPGLGGNVSWDFGDGGTSTAQNPSHIYTGTGPYTVTLTVNNNGCINTWSQVVKPCDAPLPIIRNFLQAHYRKEQSDIQLHWEVEGTFIQASIEKFNGTTWTALDTFAFEKNPNVYSQLDIKPWYHANNLYRVKYIDIDGTSHWSNIAEVWLEPLEEKLLLYPNPLDATDLHIQWSSRVELNRKWSIINSLGQVILLGEWNVQVGDNQLIIPSASLSEGVYYFRLEHQEKDITQKFIVIRKR